MPANEFEKQVQKELDELRLSPSASVWENVEQQIREKKRRRILFFLIIPFALLPIAFSLYHFGYKSAPLQAIQHGTTPQPSRENIEEETSGSKHIPRDENVATVPSGQMSGEAGRNETGEQPLDGANLNLVQSKKDNDFPVSRTDNVSGVEQSKVRVDVTKAPVLESRQPVVTAGKLRSSADMKKDEVASGNDPVRNVQPSIAPAVPTETKSIPVTTPSGSKDSLVVDSAFAATSTEAADSSNAAAPGSQMKSVPMAKRWSWGLVAGAGITSNQTSPFSLEKSFAGSRDAATGIPQTGSGAPQIPLPPSSVEPGPAFAVGGVVELKLSKRSRISAGMQYRYVSNIIRTGQRKDTTILVPTGASNNYAAQVDQIYRGAPQKEFTNRYHFISLPVAYHLQLNKGRKLPVQWDLGGAASYLVSTNALVYSGTLGGVYFHDRELFSRLHVSVATGLSVRVRTKNEKEWVLGPEFSFALNPLIKGEKQQYMLYGGISAKILFAGK